MDPSCFIIAMYLLIKNYCKFVDNRKITINQSSSHQQTDHKEKPEEPLENLIIALQVI